MVKPNQNIFTKYKEMYLINSYKNQSIIPTPIPGTEFISTWDTRNIQTGSSASNQVAFPFFVTTSGLDYYIDWGDSNVEHYTNTTDVNLVHTYASSGVYTIILWGVKTGNISFNILPTHGFKDYQKITNISQFGTSVVWNLTYNSNNKNFFSCINLTLTATDFWDRVIQGNTSIRDFFNSCTKITNLPGAETWDMSGLTYTSGAFRGCQFNQDISGWDVSNMLTNTAMIANNSVFNQEIGVWDTTKWTSTDFFFADCTTFNKPLPWTFHPTANLIFTACFSSCFAFDQDLSTWNMQNATILNSMFQSATAFTGIGVGSWVLNKPVNLYRMFFGASNFNADISGWNYELVTNIGGFLQSATSFSTENYDKLLISWASQNLNPNLSTYISSKYTLGGAAEAARAYIIATFNWTIVDLGGI